MAAENTKKDSAEVSNKISDSIVPAAAEKPEPILSKLSEYEKCSIFPQKLHALLKNNEAPDAIWWLEDGESFAIEPEQFTKVMNKVSRTGKKQVKLDSILRNLYRWGFKKLKVQNLPANALAYAHPNFKKGATAEVLHFPKHPGPTPGSPPAAATSSANNTPPPTALARALSARAQAGYGDDWNEQGAADKFTLMQQQQQSGTGFAAGGGTGFFSPTPFGVGSPYGQQQQQQQHMQLLQQQRQQQMLFQQEMHLRNQRHRHEQAFLLEAAAAERASAAQQYAAQQRLQSALYRLDGPNNSSGMDYPPPSQGPPPPPPPARYPY